MSQPRTSCGLTLSLGPGHPWQCWWHRAEWALESQAALRLTATPTEGAVPGGLRPRWAPAGCRGGAGVGGPGAGGDPLAGRPRGAGSQPAPR